MQFQKILIFGSIVAVLLALLWLVIGALLQERLPNELNPQEGFIFDYIVVGSGTTGSVVTALLAKHSNLTVLLVEAGDKFGFLSKIPLLTTFQQNGLNDWGFHSVPQKHSSKGLNEQRQSLPRGRGLGGSAQLNYMLHYDGNPLDFENWSLKHNLSDWRWEAFKPFLEAGFSKPYEMFEIQSSYSKVSAAFLSAESELAHKPWLFRKARYNIKNGLRWSVYQRFLQPVLKNRNLHIMTNVMAKKLHLVTNKDPQGTKKVVSIQVAVKNDNGREQMFTIEVRKELILAAGAYQTPQLLQVSGIGDGDLLHNLKIPLQYHLPNVGRNLHDHLNFPLFVSIDVVGPTLNQRALLDPISIMNYIFSGSGHLGNFGVLGHIDAQQHLNYGLTLFAAGAIDESALMSISNFKSKHFRALFPRYYNATQEGFVLISTCLQPHSRGSVKIYSRNIRRHPLIDPNFLSEQSDVDCMISAIRAGVELITSDAFTALGPHIHWPKIRECSNFGPFERDFDTNSPSDRYLECVIRHVALTSHHPGGSCAMGRSAINSVVDSKLRVHGIRNLRIADASILPTPISGNPNSILTGIAVRVATIILSDEQKLRE